MIKSVTIDRYGVISLLCALRRDKEAHVGWTPPDTGKKGKAAQKRDELDRKSAEIFVRDDRILYGVLQAFDERRVESITITPNYKEVEDE